ncbi:MAG: C-terminal binding protein [Candidatus Hadarchaeum sp.]|uniref:C-terminal binding protein n=1 Tax=Candidatus Hadarchaeum sp. TaxID=2883567 RepID=UPI00316DE30B
MVSRARWTVVVSDYNYPDLSIEETELARWGARVIPAQCRTPEEVLAAAEEADAIISQYAPITRAVISKLKHCKAIGRYGIGVDNIDVQAATERNIAVINVPSYCEEEVSDHVMAFLLAWARRITHYTQEIRQGVWDWKTGRPIHRLQGQVLGLLGFGKIARLVARKAKAFGLTTIAYDPYVSDEIFAVEAVKRVDFDELVKESDFLSIHVPLTAETRHLINSESLSKMKPTACIINTARGGIVDKEALFQALKTGKIAGACLDVTEPEPLDPQDPLLELPQVLWSPHVAWYSEGSLVELRSKIAQDIGRALNGLLPRGLVNRCLATQFRPS